MTNSKQRTTISKQYQFSGGRNGLLTRIEAEVLGIEFVDGMVEATVKVGVSEPMKIRLTIAQAREHDIIEEVE